ncbi:hypothetical protein CC86DRAFT_416502 [Ophiobolus disseminans]|uniref:Rhodopsin domain-containing protein n=1 Tax=Ophiobolus disseminans TaxID=1469910 RepID=A0A6A7A1L4_9PLEO|nr:hypothetical protein CC86DRAFT_416502 [Ophiobolus disseminans]
MAYDNPDGIIAAAVILEVLTAICVALRLYTRWWKKSKILTAGWLVAAAFVCGTGLTVMQIYGVKIKALAHPLNGTIEDPRAVTGRLNKIELSFLLLGVLALGLIKTSVCFLYWHTFAMVRFRRFLIVEILVIIAWTMAFILAGLLECGKHLKALFGTPDEYLNRCGSAIPSVGASVAKAYIYIQATLGRYTEDAILLLTGLSIWNLIEVQIGIIAACGPTLRPILTQLLPTESIRSLLSSMRGEKLTRKTSGDMPSFVKIGSKTDLRAKESSNTLNLSHIESHELTFRTDSDQRL